MVVFYGNLDNYVPNTCAIPLNFVYPFSIPLAMGPLQITKFLFNSHLSLSSFSTKDGDGTCNSDPVVEKLEFFLDAGILRTLSPSSSLLEHSASMILGFKITMPEPALEVLRMCLGLLLLGELIFANLFRPNLKYLVVSN